MASPPADAPVPPPTPNYDVLVVRTWKPPCDIASVIEDLLEEDNDPVWLGGEFLLRVPTARRADVVDALRRRSHVCGVSLLVPGETHGRLLFGRANDAWYNIRGVYVGDRRLAPPAVAPAPSQNQ